MNSFPINTKLINKMNTDCKQVNALAEKNNDRENVPLLIYCKNYKSMTIDSSIYISLEFVTMTMLNYQDF